MNYAIYLRKSRADLEYENEIDTLVKHEKTLLEFAEKRGLTISNIYKEVVSGDTIASRPQMQKLLADVEQGLYEGVLVMEVERLARGDTIDQGIVAQAFKYSDTKIITPIKTYDPNNEYDEEYFEFGLFMSRREFKTIKRRLNAGRLRSVKDGNYIGSVAPYGYEKARIDKRWTLIIKENEADIVKMIFNMYINGASKNEIAKKLNSMQISTKYGYKWLASGVRDLLKNPTYIGKLKWNTRKEVKTVVNGKVKISRPRDSKAPTFNGIHQPIIDIATWNKTQELNEQQEIRATWSTGIKNPLAKLIYCEKCGKVMQRRPYQKRGQAPTLICTNTNCNNISSPLHIVEEKILDTLQDIYSQYRYDKKTQNNKTISLREQYQKQLKKEKEKLERIYSAYEDGMYSKIDFGNRKKVVEDKINELNKLIEEDTQKITKTEMMHRLNTLLEGYNNASVEEKNELLKSVCKKIIYRKDKKCLKNTDDPYEFELTFYLKYQE